MRSYDEYLQQNPNEVTIFEYARTGNLEEMNQALEKSPSLDINLKDHKGYSALMYAAYNGHTNLVLSLIAQGANIESPDKGGRTVLMGVAYKGHVDIAQVLIEAGADIDATNFVGMTAMQFAQMFGRTEVAALLSQKRVSYIARVLEPLRAWFLHLKLS